MCIGEDEPLRFSNKFGYLHRNQGVLLAQASLEIKGRNLHNAIQEIETGLTKCITEVGNGGGEHLVDLTPEQAAAFFSVSPSTRSSTQDVADSVYRFYQQCNCCIF